MTDKTILVVGATGSFGSAYVEHLWHNTDYKIRALSRDEHKQISMMRKYPPGPRMTYVLCDIRDRDAMRVATDGVWAVVHAAALKTVESGSYHFEEVTKTNVLGTNNVLMAARDSCVSKFLFIGSDKAVLPRNNYGFSKGMGERLTIDYNQLSSSVGTKFFAVRGGNIWKSNGSVAVIWSEDIRQGKPIRITNANTTRFHLEMKDWVVFCHRVLEEGHGGEVFVPKARSWRLGDLAEAFGAPREHTFSRDADKMHEVLVSKDEAGRVIDNGWAYVVEPSLELRAVWNYQTWRGWTPPDGFEYTSEHADKLSVEELRELICSS